VFDLIKWAGIGIYIIEKAKNRIGTVDRFGNHSSTTTAPSDIASDQTRVRLS